MERMDARWSKGGIVLTKNKRPNSGSINVARQNRRGKHSSQSSRPEGSCRSVDGCREMKCGRSRLRLSQRGNTVLQGLRLSRCGCGYRWSARATAQLANA